jgi:hypothetical protein
MHKWEITTWVFEKYELMMWAGLIWLGIGTNGCLEHNEISNSREGGALP